MKFFRRLLLLAIPCFVLSAVAFRGWTQTAPAGQRTADTREEAYRANNLGVALLEQYKYKEGAEAFMRALRLDPQLKLARINLSIALYNVPDLAGAQREAEKAAAADASAPQPVYILGLIAKSQNRTDDAIIAFQKVLKIDPRDTGANVQLGQLYAQQKKYTEAIAAFRTAISVEPYNMTALYNLGLALTRTNERAEGQQMINRFQQLRQSGAGTTIGQNYLEQGRYAEAVASTGAESELVESSVPDVKFTDATESMLPPSGAKGGAGTGASAAVLGGSLKGGLTDAAELNLAAALGASATLFDYDLDGDLDLLSVTPAEARLLRNDEGKFTDVTDKAGALSAKSTGFGVGAVAGDYDNDGKPDLFILRQNGASALYHNDGDGKFSNVTTAAGIPKYPYFSISTAFVDADHDGDLDIVIAGFADLSKPRSAAAASLNTPDDFAGAPNMILRNDGTGKFTDVTATAKISGTANHAVAIVPTDYDNRRDVDLLVVNYGAPTDLFSNQRDGSFRNVAPEVSLDAQGHGTAVAAGDVNKDGFTDFFFAGADAAGLFALSDGQGKFKSVGAPAATKGASAAQFLDYDDDGLLDCVMLTDVGLRVLRNTGNEWMDVSEKAVATELTSAAKIDATARTLASGDLDGDGDTDLVLRSSAGELRIARNDGGNRNRSLRVNLFGKVSNRSGVGAKIEARAGSLVQKLETYSASPAPAPADVVFGLGNRTGADAVRVLWPAGIVQAETEIAARNTDPKKTATVLPVTELDRKPSSCPYLYTWNGERFEFITDFMGGGEMGYWEAPGHYNTPDPEEYVRIRSDQLKERDGRFELRVTNELEEVLYVDRLQLMAIAHPAGTEIYPNEGMTTPPRPFKLYTTRGARPPLSAVDDHGHDVLSRITQMDRQYPDDFPLGRIRGYAGEHSLTMRLDRSEKRRTVRTLLLLTGWTDYAFSSDNVAASHAGLEMKLPALQVKDARGRWHTVIEDIGIPVGRPQTVTVDLTGKFLSASREVRIVTSMRIYWDQILVDTSDGKAPVQVTPLDPSRAELRWRGYSREVTPDGREPFGYNYDEVSFTSPWKVFPGSYTHEGDVRELLLKTDDIFVISRTGDELSLSFDANALPKLPMGWTRTFLLYSDGFSKEMDINSASPDQVLPLPFHGMTRYPYRAPEAYPMTAARRAYYDRYNTRIVAAPVQLIEAVLASEINKPQMNTDRRR